ncbi:hypothetical protein SAMN05192550_1646 [Flavobacterium glycines]|uniref:Uncharacterized protein n=1 Tax=Flavobacterium glycines TaxID=551990 RepID=A0A1B9DY96_9FLAO|nr:hypothetical protein [Flavobacterium glycines]OCB74665.1 hypothetical protein FBGL_01470 [Flavobacterium glycines]GEL09358.1 hypothetical protein FGL01_00970 [Flavobacterium glycines]SDJ09812.1 hypothetical protein SAMN05192550_1646 [Flavobacterium glycines]
MSAIELKNLLISKIAGIDDEAFLSAINTILDTKAKNTENNNPDLQKIIILTEQQKKEIQNSQKEYSEGHYVDNDSVNEEMEKWLREE